VKKPVNLGFLDFSTLEKRHHFCQRELELNWRLCPEVYLGAVPIYASGDDFSFKADGELAEYTLKMKELPKGWFLRELLAKELVGETEVNRVISCLHRFYEAQTPRPEVEAWETPEKLKISTDENFAQVEAFAGETISPVAFQAIRHFTNAFYAANKRLFHERIQQHRIRDCHGDLHLDHVHITPEATTIFDCIEFNDRFRFIDIANDLAFLAMDFDFEGKRELANLLLRKAAGELGDAGLLKLVTFYKCYRAFVRGKVESIQASSKGAADAQEHTKRAVRYFRRALRYATSGSQPLVLVIMGRVGTGKTTVARQLGSELDWPVFSSDRIRKTLAAVPLTERTAPELRDKVYSEADDRSDLQGAGRTRTGRTCHLQWCYPRRDVFESRKAQAPTNPLMKSPRRSGTESRPSMSKVFFFARSCNARFVYENVNTPKSFPDVGKHRSHFPFARYIQMPILANIVFTCDLLRSIFTLHITHIRDRHSCSFFREKECRRAADPECCPGDDCDFISYSIHRSIIRCSRAREVVRRRLVRGRRIGFLFVDDILR
jgi:aminoglycoside phosphotransferase family enzyme